MTSVSLSPGIPLDNIFGGMERCFQHLGDPVALGLTIPTGASAGFPLLIPADPGFAGVQIRGQGVLATNPPNFTTSGLLTTNGLDMRLGAM